MLLKESSRIDVLPFCRGDWCRVGGVEPVQHEPQRLFRMLAKCWVCELELLHPVSIPLKRILFFDFFGFFAIHEEGMPH